MKVAPTVLGALFLAAVIIVPLLLVGMLFRRSGHHEQRATGAEAELMQELYQGLSRLEQRVESLETILLSREPRGDGK